MEEAIKISLAAARVNAKMTQKDAANALSVTKQTIINWEHGRITPRPMQVKCLSMLYNIPVDNIFLPDKCT